MANAIMVLAVSMGLAAAPHSTTQVATNSVAGAAAAHSSGSTTQARPAAPEETYCTSGTITGSRVVKQECKTKAEWAKDGVDIEDLMNGQE